MKKAVVIMLALMLLFGSVGFVRADEMPGDTSDIGKGEQELTSTDGLALYDIVTFGQYPQSAFGDMAPIEWIVTGISGNRVRLLSRYALDSRKYHNGNLSVSWQRSKLYEWLNSTFLETAFTAEEQQWLYAPVSLPSVAEANELPLYLRICESTGYAISQGADPNKCIWWLSSGSGEYQVKNGEWWWSDTRTANCASVVLETGKIAKGGFQVNYSGKTVRPTIILSFGGSSASATPKPAAIKSNEAKPTATPKSADAGSQKATSKSGVRMNGQKLTSTEDVELYDVVTFGSYPQTVNGNTAAIEWIVTGISGSRLRLLSRYALDSKKYHNGNLSVSWQNSQLYNWLNGTFRKNAFTAEEQKLIYTSISLPTVEEAKELPQYIRICEPTGYAVGQGAKQDQCDWWLSSGSTPCEVSYNGKTWTAYCAAAVHADGKIWNPAYQVNYSGQTVRPTVIVDLGGSGAANVTPQPEPDTEPEIERQIGVMLDGEPVASADDLQVLDVVTFGYYPQTAKGALGPIEWIVLDVDGDQVTLLSKYALDSQKYHNGNLRVSWQNSKLYAWLNSTFWDTAFVPAEQRMLTMPVTLPTVEQASSMPLSLRICTSTAYAIQQGADPKKCIWWLSSGSGEYQVKNGEWWWSDTRTANCASVVMANGQVAKAGYQVNYSGKTVRPLIVIEIDETNGK